MGILFDKYMDDLEKNNTDSKIFNHFLNHKHPDYKNSFSPAEQVRDFIATMTDRYYNEELKDFLLPWKW
jgi:dGTPase